MPSGLCLRRQDRDKTSDLIQAKLVILYQMVTRRLNMRHKDTINLVLKAMIPEYLSTAHNFGQSIQ